MAAASCGVAVLFLLPFIVGTILRLLRPKHWFVDFEALSCGGQAVYAKLPLYVWDPSCPGMKPTIYVYTPAAAKLFALLQHLLGLTGEIVLYGGVFWIIVYSVFAALIRQDGRLQIRAPFLAGIPGNALSSGNASVVIHGLIFLRRGWLAARPALAVPLIAGATIVKPTFVVYLALFLFLNRPMRQRLLLLSGCAAIVAAYFLHFHYADPTDFAKWQALTGYFGLTNDRGDGFLALPAVSHLSTVPSIAACYALFAAMVLSSGLILAECCEDESDKLLLGIATCLLLYPRLMGYDVFTLPFGLAVAVSCFQRLGRFEAQHLAWAVRAVCGVCGLLSLIGGRFGEKLFFGFSCLLLFFLAATAVSAKVTAAKRRDVERELACLE